MHAGAERKMIHTNGKITMRKFKSYIFFNDLRWEGLVLLLIMVELLTITIETFLQNYLILFAYEIQSLSKKNLEYVYTNIVWLDTSAS
jgi:hypothetical protein